MKKPKHTYQNKYGVYYARLQIPTEIRHYYEQKSDYFEKSLRTKNVSEALARSTPLLIGWDAEFEFRKKLHKPSQSSIHEAVIDYFNDQLKYDRKRRSESGDPRMAIKAVSKALGENKSIKTAWDGVMSHDVRLEEYKQEREELETAVRRSIATGDMTDFKAIARDFADEKRFDLGDDEMDEFCHSLAQISLEFLKAAKKIDVGEMHYVSNNPILSHLNSEEGRLRLAPSDKTVGVLVERWMKDNTYKRSTESAYRQGVRFFAEYVGEDYDVRDTFTLSNAREFKFKLEKVPVKASEAREFRGLKFLDVIERNKSVGKAPLSPARQDNLFKGLKGFGRWLEEHDLIKENPFRRIRIKVDKDANRTPAFKIEQLSELFSSPIYTGAESSNSPSKPGDVEIRDHRFWMPLVGLYTGARVGEVAMLELGDVVQEDGTWIFWMSTEKQAKNNTKTARDYLRPVPIHQQLIDLGLLAYVEDRRSGKSKHVFPGAAQDGEMDFAGRYSDEFRSYLTKIGLKKGADRLGFHSFRSTFITEAGKNGVRRTDTALLVGHGAKTVTAGYDKGYEGTIAQRAEWVNAVKYEGLDLS